ncbi:unnamed protein product [Notodromas monacha]|uniref:NADH dehydrogenase [ubiquinone] 1 alpha subcomplex subunit 9, mitochondrial n=1 Tax=Notodromas monacha TaxID=399045 RepID=A0A7R9BHX5_9CRUS|nr:unnamed protein product [Notodromas monacha]CAG0914982.1 unnamed protein product [Notodromas monacha]
MLAVRNSATIGVGRIATARLTPSCLIISERHSSNGSKSANDVEIQPLKATSLANLRRGTGGRSSFNGLVVTVLGATGFVGRYVCNRLGKIGSQLILPYRGDNYDPLRLRLVGDLGQVLFTPYQAVDLDSLRKSMRYSNVVVNLIGRDYETRNFNFHRVHVEVARNVAKIAKEMGVERLIHFSALNASENPPSTVIKGGSKFLKTKWLGEQAVREEYPEAIIFRPADVWGQEDRFMRYHAMWWRRQSSFYPLWKKGDHVIKQPVYVGDVAGGVVNAIFERNAEGKTYEIVGPQRFVLGELIDYFHRVMRKMDTEWGYKRYDMRFDPTYFLKIIFNEKINPASPINTMTWEKLERENVTDTLSGLPRLEDLGVSPLTTIHERASWELMPYNAYNYYDAELDEFARPDPPPTVVES